MKRKCVLKKHKNHPSINVITDPIKNLGIFRFSFISRKVILKELIKLKYR